jgi:tRNA(adenine34) deaminase
MNAMRQAAAATGNYRLTGSTLYVTLEPCPMCAGALVWARIKRVVFGAYDPKAGALGSTMDLAALTSLNHHPEILGGLMADECAQLLKEFFAKRRKSK